MAGKEAGLEIAVTDWFGKGSKPCANRLRRGCLGVWATVFRGLRPPTAPGSPPGKTALRAFLIRRCLGNRQSNVRGRETFSEAMLAKTDESPGIQSTMPLLLTQQHPHNPDYGSEPHHDRC